MATLSKLSHNQNNLLVATVCALFGAFCSWWIVETRCRNIWAARPAT